MYNTRRTFLRNTAITLAGTSFLPKQFIFAKERELVGIQLYSVRDDMRKDPLATLKQLSDIGYKYVEHANYVNRKFYGHSAVEFKKILDDLGLKMKSGHTVMSKQHWDESKKDFTDSWKNTVEDAATVGQEFVISPWLDESLRKNYDELSHFLDLFNKSGEL
ncbi:MAG TPA: sugar phosphate isomerase/epimerase, partial [Flavisolibacter sp.]|nr:sugar phosphate isomerase/epimerase [Flavisolibacter sp.]